jgi:siroheme synthase-like protein
VTPYPLFVDVSRCRALVVGGGAVACRKVRGLLDAGGRPQIVSPEVLPDLRELIGRHDLPWSPREYRPGDAAGCHLVFAATSVREVNAAVAREASEAGALVDVADDGSASTFHVPAVIRRDEVVVALSTGGASPLLARRLRERLEATVTDGLGRAARRLSALRAQVRARWPGDEARRRSLWFDLITPGFMDDAVAGRDAEVEMRIARCLSQS